MNADVAAGCVGMPIGVQSENQLYMYKHTLWGLLVSADVALFLTAPVSLGGSQSILLLFGLKKGKEVTNISHFMVKYSYYYSY